MAPVEVPNRAEVWGLLKNTDRDSWEETIRNSYSNFAGKKFRGLDILELIISDLDSYEHHE